MPFRKLKYKNVQDSRATHVGRPGELFIDENTNELYVSDGSTVGGNAVSSGITPIYEFNANSVSTTSGSPTDLPAGYKAYLVATERTNTNSYVKIPDGTVVGQTVVAGYKQPNLNGQDVFFDFKASDGSTQRVQTIRNLTQNFQLFWNGAGWTPITDTHIV